MVFKILHKFLEPIRFRKTIPLQTAIPHAQHRSVNRSLLHILQLRIKAILRNSLEHQPGPEEMWVGTKKRTQNISKLNVLLLNWPTITSKFIQLPRPQILRPTIPVHL